MNEPWKRHSRGFTMVELVIVIVLIGIVTMISSRAMQTTMDAYRYKATVKKMVQIRMALVGDENAVLGGQRTSFGYVGDQKGFPPSNPFAAISTALDAYFRTGAEYKLDAWGTRFSYSSVGSLITITSLGADRANGGTGYASDITLYINKDLYWTTIKLRFNAFDAKGVVLRFPPGGGGDNHYQLKRVELWNVDTTGSPTTLATTFTSSETEARCNTRWVGRYVLRVYPTDGSGGTKNWVPYLMGGTDPVDVSGEECLEEEITVYPKVNGCFQYLVVRFPGAMNETFLNE